MFTKVKKKFQIYIKKMGSSRRRNFGRNFLGKSTKNNKIFFASNKEY